MSPKFQTNKLFPNIKQKDPSKARVKELIKTKLEFFI